MTVHQSDPSAPPRPSPLKREHQPAPFDREGEHLEVVERGPMVWIQAPRAARLGGASNALATEIVAACSAIRERAERPALVALAGGAHFFAEPPSSAADCDAAAPGWRAATDAVASLSTPTIAVIAGDAVGPAWELALACDLRVASRFAHVGSTEIRFGRIPSAGGTQHLVRAAGPTVALRLLLRGSVLSTSEAADLGLIHVVDTADDQASGSALLAALCEATPIALAYTKEAASSSARMPLATGLRLEADLAALLLTTADRAEGIHAFIERRKPHFTGT